MDDESRGDLSKDLFDQLDAIKSNFVLDLDYQHFEKQCFLINKLLFDEPLKTTQNHLKPSENNRNLLQPTTNYPILAIISHKSPETLNSQPLNAFG